LPALQVYNVKKNGSKFRSKNAKFLDFQGGRMQTTERYFFERFIHERMFFSEIFVLLFGCAHTLNSSWKWHFDRKWQFQENATYWTQNISITITRMKLIWLPMKSSTLIYSSIKSSNKLNKFEIWKIFWAHMSAYCPWSFSLCLKEL
jgi:hypothetical protein